MRFADAFLTETRSFEWNLAPNPILNKACIALEELISAEISWLWCDSEIFSIVNHGSILDVV
jgi:hypothetical protein